MVGGSSGMGLATGRAAHAAGADVVLVARDADRLATARDELGGSTRARAVDAADDVAVESLFDELGAVDHVVSFTGNQPLGSVGDTTYELYRAALDARVWAARNLCASGAPRMAEGGSFTFCSGVSAWRPRPQRAAGAAATAGLESFARGMAVELAPIRVNTICPGAFDTPVLDRAFGERKEEALRSYLSTLPLGRLGQPDELAHAAIFLMTNSYVTGTVLHVDGGSLLI
ncbi:MAG: SDR family oxidoreductase [Acidimicrobiia bacterium]|nr:SDR family oxidoreductase [Acidimicrobiia bacterium]